VPGCHFSAFIDAWEAENHERNFLAQSSALAYSSRDWKYLKNFESRTDEY
jgi:hypothetical protein